MIFSKGIRLFVTACLVLGSCAANLKAQQAIAPEKRELIKELLVATNAQKNAAAVVESMLAQNEKNLPKIIEQIVAQHTGITSSNQEELQKTVAESVARTNRRFKELFMQRVNFGQFVEDLTAELYDKYFTEAELKDLLAFYKSETGKKSIEVMPKLFAESMTRTSDALTPQIQQIMEEIIGEEMKQLQTAQPPAARQPVKNQQRRRRL